MSKITIELDEAEIKILEKRADKNLFSLREQIEDIVRRSCVSYSKKTSTKQIKVDDRLVAVFSRQRSGRKKVKKKKSAPKKKIKK